MSSISVIVPVYNGETYLRECLDSICGQDYRDMDVTVVDDGSTDSSAAIAASYAESDPRVKLLRLPANRGLSAARNAGLDASGGAWVTFVDADDCLHPGALGLLARVAASAGTDIVAFRQERGAEFSPHAAAPCESPRIFGAEEAVAEGLYQRLLDCSACGKLFRREMLGSRRFTEGILYEDLDFIPRVMLHAAGGVALVPQSLYFYRRTPGSILHTFSPRRLAVLKVADDLCDYFARERPSLCGAARSRRLSASFNMLGLAAGALRVPDVSPADAAIYREACDDCLRYIRRHRGACLRDPRLRAKNRLGLLLSYLPAPILTRILR